MVCITRLRICPPVHAGCFPVKPKAELCWPKPSLTLLACTRLVGLLTQDRFKNNCCSILRKTIHTIQPMHKQPAKVSPPQAQSLIHTRQRRVGDADNEPVSQAAQAYVCTAAGLRPCCCLSCSCTAGKPRTHSSDRRPTCRAAVETAACSKCVFECT